MDDSFTPTPAPDVRVRRIGGRLVLVSNGSEVHQLNETAEVIWGLCDGQRTVAGVVAEMEKEYSVDAVKLRGDVEKLLEELRLVGALEN